MAVQSIQREFFYLILILRVIDLELRDCGEDEHHDGGQQEDGAHYHQHLHKKDLRILLQR